MDVNAQTVETELAITKRRLVALQLPAASLVVISVKGHTTIFLLLFVRRRYALHDNTFAKMEAALTAQLTLELQRAEESVRN
jgi:hypothetical protein